MQKETPFPAVGMAELTSSVVTHRYQSFLFRSCLSTARRELTRRGRWRVGSVCCPVVIGGCQACCSLHPSLDCMWVSAGLLPGMAGEPVCVAVARLCCGGLGVHVCR